MKKLTGWTLVLLMLGSLAAWATDNPHDISHTPAVPGDLLPSDKVPMGRPSSGAADGKGVAYTATVSQISRAVFKDFSSQGILGASGLSGPPGQAATVAAGTVTTLAPGSPATVTNVGTSSAAVFNFGIPRGADGTSGSETQATIKSKLGAATNSVDGYLTAADHAAFAGKQNALTAGVDYLTPVGNAATATRLQTPRNINGVSFDGSSNITITDTTREPVIPTGTTAQYIRGDKSLATFPTFGTAAAKDVPASGNASTTQVVLGSDGRLADARTPLTHNQDATTITTGVLDGDRLPAISTTKKGAVPATGTPSGKYLKDDGTWATVASGTTTKAAAYPSTDDNYGVTAAYVDAALNGGFTINTSDATQKGKIAGWDATTGVLGAASLPTCVGSEKITSNGSTLSCAADQTGTAGTGITSLNGATVSSQTFADGANVHISTNTGTGVHTIGITGTIPDGNIASAATWNAKQSPQTTLAGYGITDAYTKSFLDAALTGKLDTTTAATTYHTKAAFNAYSAAQSVKLAAKMNDTSGNPDGTRYVWVYNTTACPTAASTPVGALCTLPGGIYQNTGSAWVVPPDVASGYSLPTASTSTLGGVKVDGITITISGGVISSTGGYSLPIAGASTLGGVKVGSGLTIDGSGVLSAMAGSVNGSGLILAGLTGNQTVKKGFAYIAQGNFKATFQNFSSGIATVTSFNNYSGRIVPASGGKFAWSNPVTFANNTTAAGYSVKVPPNSSVTLQSLGTGTYYATTTRNLVKTGINEYAGVAASTATYAATAGTVGTSTLAASKSLTVGNLVVYAVTYTGSVTLSSVSDGANTWHVIGTSTPSAGQGYASALAYTVATTGGSVTATGTLSGAATIKEAQLIEISSSTGFPAGTASFDTMASANGTAIGTVGPTLTTASANEVAVGALSGYWNGTYSAGSGMTQLSSGGNGHSYEWGVLASAGSNPVRVNYGGTTGDWSMIAAAFRGN